MNGIIKGKHTFPSIFRTGALRMPSIKSRLHLQDLQSKVPCHAMGVHTLSFELPWVYACAFAQSCHLRRQ